MNRRKAGARGSRDPAPEVAGGLGHRQPSLREQLVAPLKAARTSRRLVSALALMLAVTLFDFRLAAGDWPQYRGPNHNGVSSETIRLNWSQERPRQLWKVALDPALSSFSVSGGKAFTQVRRRMGSEDQEVCVALDAETGRELWATPLGLASYPDGGVGFDDGPRSTPSIDGARVYVLTSYLRIACLDASQGSVIWSKDLVAEYGATVIPWQNAASPLIVGDLVVMNSNVRNQRLLALRKVDGGIAWRGQNDAMTQASPIAATIAGVPQIVFLAQSGLVSVIPETGAVLWRFSLPYSTSSAASPVVGGDIVYASAAYGVGSGAARLTRAGVTMSASQAWRAPGGNMNHWATPVSHQGYLYGIYGQSLLSLRCVELATGTEKWRQSGVGYGSVLLVSDRVLVLTEDGTLLLVEPDPTGYREAARFQAVRGKCWNVPAISDGRIYVRSTTEAACFDVSTAPPPKLKLLPSFTNGRFQLFIGSEDGSSLDPSRAAKIDVLTGSDLGVVPAEWTKLSITPVWANGQFRVVDLPGLEGSARFFLTLERP